MSDYRANACRLEDVAAYLDGELNAGAHESFEKHVKYCRSCAAELLAQRQLLCTLDVAFNDERSFHMPKNFTRLVTTRAESDLRGLRNKRERRRAFQMCAALAVISFVLLGAAARTIVFDPVKSFWTVGSSLLQLAGDALSGLAASAAVVIRVIGHAVLFPQRGLGLWLVLAFLFSISFLLILIAKYHRGRIVE